MKPLPYQIEFTLLSAPDDPGRVCYETQAKLLAIQESLRDHRVNVLTVGALPSGDTQIGQFIITLGLAAIPAIAAIAGAWIETRSGCIVRLKLDEAEAGTVGALGDFIKGSAREPTRMPFG